MVCAESDANAIFTLQVKEIFNYSQDDLTTEDVLILDCHSDIYVWVGRHSSVNSKLQALTLGLVMIECLSSMIDLAFL